MRASIVGLLFFLGLTTLCYSQADSENLLTEVEVYAKNYNYLKSVNSDESALKEVHELERKVASFDVNSLNLYRTDFDNYQVSFFNSHGVIRASYDNESNLIRTVERFKNVNLPLSVRKSIVKRYPNYLIAADEYYVRYHHKKGATKKFKILMEKNGKQFWINTDENGIIL
jgi:hypothetical protein